MQDMEFKRQLAGRSGRNGAVEFRLALATAVGLFIVGTANAGTHEPCMLSGACCVARRFQASVVLHASRGRPVEV
jgi:hypothetical protein